MLEVHWREDSPTQPLVERDGLRFCAVQWADRLHYQADDVLFLPCHHVVARSLRVYKRREENVSNPLLVSFSAIAQDNEGNQTTVS